MISGIKQPVLLFDAVKKKEGSDMRKYKKTLALCLAALLALEFSGGGSRQALTALAQPAESGAAPERKMVSGSPDAVRTVTGSNAGKQAAAAEEPYVVGETAFATLAEALRKRRSSCRPMQRKQKRSILKRL